MYADEDDENYELSDDVELSDNEDNEQQKDTEFKIVTFEDVKENIQKKHKKTIPLLTKFERARIMGVRLQQLAYGAKPRIDTSGLNSMKEIVEQEMILRKLPLIIRRYLPNGDYEDWKIEEFQTV